MSGYYNLAGQRISRDVALTEPVQSLDARRVGKDQIGDVEVSTVHLVMDHSFGDGPPLIFESMVFGSDHSDLHCERYSTLADATTGHAALVERARAGEWAGGGEAR